MRYASYLVLLPALLLLAENAQRHIEGHSPVRLVHDLADSQVTREAAKDICVFAAELLLLSHPADRVANCVLGVIDKVWPECSHAGVAHGGRFRLEWCRRQ